MIGLLISATIKKQRIAANATNDGNNMTVEERLATYSFLLGKAHGGIVSILMGCDHDYEKVEKLKELSASLSKDIEKLFSTNSTS